MPQALGLVETKGLVGAIVAADAMLKAANVTLIGKEKIAPALITIKIIGETAAVKSSIEAGAAAAQRVGQLISTLLIPNPDLQLRNIFPEIVTEAEDSDISGDEPTPTTEATISPKVEKTKEEPKLPKEKKAVPIREVAKVTPKVSEEEVTEQKIASLFDVVAESEIIHSENTLARLKAEALKDLQSEIENSIEDKKVELPESEVKSKHFDTSSPLEELETYNVHQLRKLARGVEIFPIHGREISRANRDTLLAYFRAIKE